ncbi:MAG: sterol desaturase family protein [Thermoplasmatota archaeon]
MAFVEEAIGTIVFVTIIGGGFALMERKWPLVKQRTFRKGWFTDALHLFFTGFLDRAFQFVGIVIAFLLVGWWAPATLAGAIQSQPLALQYLEAFLLANVLGYWAHRLSHTVPLLWRFHKVHHSSQHLDWLAGVRRHPLEQTWSGLLVGAPLIFFGFTLFQVAAVDIVLGFWGIFLHANTRFNGKRIRHLIATPAYHHWHHSDDPMRYNTNYSLFPWIDGLFGTKFISDERATTFGVPGYEPGGYVKQMIEPFRRVERRVAFIERSKSPD